VATYLPLLRRHCVLLILLLPHCFIALLYRLRWFSRRLLFGHASVFAPRVFFSLLDKLADTGLYFRNFFLFLNSAKLSQDLLEHFHDFFTKWKVFMWMLSIQSSFFSDSSRDVAIATNFVAKLWQNYLPSALIALSFRNKMGYRYLNVRVNSVNDASI